MSDKNQLYFGDNLDVLRRYVADASVDLVYLDPPFNSNANYNVLFKEHDGANDTMDNCVVEPASQIQAFEDTWRSHGVCQGQAAIGAGRRFVAKRLRWVC